MQLFVPLIFPQEPGDVAEVDGREYYFERVDPDHAVYYRAPHGAKYPDLMVKGSDGHPRRPTTSEINAMFAADRLILRSKPSGVVARRFARAQALDANQCRAMDKHADFRIKLALYCEEHCTSRSDAKMRLVIKRALMQPEFVKLNPDAWVPDPSTVRNWMRERGEPGRRKIRDGVSATGRWERSLKYNHPVEIGHYWVLSAALANGHRQIAHFHDEYIAEICRINRGIPPNRGRLLQDADGVWTVSEELAHYDKPNEPYQYISYNTFWRRVNHIKTRKLFGLATTANGERNRYGGGGVGERTSFGSLCEIDETPVPYIFLVDDDTGIPMGTATLTLMIECSVKALVGWDLCAEAASSLTLLRTVRHANSVKTVPQYLLDEFPDLPYVRMRPDRIICDNSSGAHSKHFEDACAEAYIVVEWAGKNSPTGKPLVERTIGTNLETLFKKLPGHNYDIALMRKYGFDPDTQILCSLSKGKELLDQAAFTYNVTRHAGL